MIKKVSYPMNTKNLPPKAFPMIEIAANPKNTDLRQQHHHDI